MEEVIESVEMHHTAPLPTDSGPHKISVAKHIGELFALEVRTAKANPNILLPESPEEFLSFLTEEHASETYVWNSPEGELAGYVSVIIEPDDPIAEVLSIGVDLGFQRQGYGQELMVLAERLARTAGKHKMKLVTAISNEAAQKFYQSLGYQIVGESEYTYADGKPRYQLEKSLDTHA